MRQRLRLTLNGEERVLGPIGEPICVVLALPAISLAIAACVLIVVACIFAIPAFVATWAVTRGR